jgi:hypothetical protein
MADEQQVPPETGDDEAPAVETTTRAKETTTTTSKPKAAPDKPASTRSAEQLAADLESAERRIGELNVESAGRRKRLESYEKAEKERQDAELSELDRLRKSDAERAETVASLQSDLRVTRLAHRAEVLALQLKFRDPDDALKLADLSAVEFDDEGHPDPKGVKAALKKLAEAKPHLVADEAPEPPRPPGTPSRDRPNGAAANAGANLGLPQPSEKRPPDLQHQLRQMGVGF